MATSSNDRAGNDSVQVLSFEVDPGDEIEWTGRRVVVLDINRDAGTPRRPGVFLTIEGEGVPVRRCHYFDHEAVKCWRSDD